MRGTGRPQPPVAAPLQRLQPTTVLRVPDGFSFAAPVTITIHYSDDDIAGLDESTLRIVYWTGTAWAETADTCVPPSGYVRDLANNVLSVAACHLTEFAMVGE
jgi:hypothetical protein